MAIDELSVRRTKRRSQREAEAQVELDRVQDAVIAAQHKYELRSKRMKEVWAKKKAVRNEEQ